jgi:hypothetical protein
MRWPYRVVKIFALAQLLPSNARSILLFHVARLGVNRAPATPNSEAKTADES